MPALRILWKSLPVALIALLIAGSVAAQETSTTEETPAPVPLTSAQRRAVRVFADDGILAGTSCSVQDCSGIAARWEVALWVVRNLDSEPTSHRAFADVDSEEPYAGHVQTMFDLGATVGCMVDPLRYCPNRETRRGQMAAFVTRAYDLDDTIPPHGFADVPRSHVFRDNISALKNAGILSSGCAEGEGLFCPDDPIVAAEAVEWLYRASRLDTTESRSDGGGGGGGGGAGRGGGGRWRSWRSVAVAVAVAVAAIPVAVAVMAVAVALPRQLRQALPRPQPLSLAIAALAVPRSTSAPTASAPTGMLTFDLAATTRESAMASLTCS